METSGSRPTPDEAAAALLDADAARDQLSHDLTPPSWFHTSIGLAIGVQIATILGGVAEQSSAGIGLASRVVFGSGAAASSAHLLAMGAAIWAVFEQRWWLVGSCAIAGSAGYTLCGVRWIRSYRSDPAACSRGESVLLLVALVVALIAGAVLLLAGAG